MRKATPGAALVILAILGELTGSSRGAIDTILRRYPKGAFGSCWASFTVSSSASAWTYEYRLDESEAWMSGVGTGGTRPGLPLELSFQLSELASGPHRIQVRARAQDGATIDPTPATAAWNVREPDTLLVNAWTGIRRVPPGEETEVVLSSQVRRYQFEYAVDGQAWAPVASNADLLDFPRSVRVPLAAGGEGEHVARFRAVDECGNRGPARELRWVTAWVASALVDVPESPYSRQAQAAFALAADVVAFGCRWRLDGGEWWTCELERGAVESAGAAGASSSSSTARQRVGTLTDGPHHLQVIVTDGAGHEEKRPYEHWWTVDTTPPQTLILAAPAYHSNQPSASFMWACEDALPCQVEYSLDEAAWVRTGDAEITVKRLSQREHSLALRAVDAAGNVDPEPIIWTWRVDCRTPETYFARLPPRLSTSPSAAFELGSDEAHTSFVVRVDGGTWGTVGVRFRLDNLTDGMHHIQAKAVDAAANDDATPAAFSWLVDTTPPRTALLGGWPVLEDKGFAGLFDVRLAVQALPMPSDTVQSMRGWGWEWRVNGGAWRPGQTAVHLGPEGAYELRIDKLLPGIYVVEARVKDRLGNVDPYPAFLEIDLRKAEEGSSPPHNSAICLLAGCLPDKSYERTTAMAAAEEGAALNKGRKDDQAPRPGAQAANWQGRLPAQSTIRRSRTVQSSRKAGAFRKLYQL